MMLLHPRNRLTWIILGSAALLSLAATMMIAHQNLHELHAAHNKLALGLSRQLARSSHLALLAGDELELQEIARTVLDTDPILGQIIIEGTRGQTIVKHASQRPAPEALNTLDRWAAGMAKLAVHDELEMVYVSQIPPVGEGSLLDPFGTARAGIGQARLALSQGRYQRELADVFYQAALLWMLLFVVLAATGTGIAWMAALPMLKLGRSLSVMTGATDTPHVNAPQAYADIERNLEAIGHRLTRSEDEAREATQALRGQTRQLADARAHARNATRMRADLVAGMSHELRTPLTAILSHSDLLDRSPLNKRQRENVTTVKKSARNLLRLIDDVLEWSGIEAGKANLNEIGFNLSEVVEDTVGLLAPLSYEKDLELAHIIYQDVPVRLRGDPQRFQQILTNLVSNAIKFTRTGGITIRVMLEDESDESVSVRVSVADSGPGIDKDAQVRLFDMYERLDQVTEIGTGLGLAICKKLLEIMGGHISVDSQLGKGADFQFVVPFKKSQHREQNFVAWSDLQGIKVWLQDDYTTARMALAHQLEHWQIELYEMDTRYDLQSCLEDMGTDTKPDAIIIGLHAAQACQNDVQALLAACRAAGVVVITLVTSIDPELHAQLEQFGATASLAKSTNRLQLYRQLCQATGRTQAESKAPLPLAGINALVADNSAAARGYLATLLTSLGAGVAQTHDGNSALAAWRKAAFPLILLDEQMPGATGSEIARQIRALATPQNQPVLVGVTADSRPQIHAKLLDAGMDTCLVKPFDAQQLLRCVQPLLENLPIADEAAPDMPRRADTLAADPQLAALLEHELPEQLKALEAALAQSDITRAKAEVHTLHGTAAFYGLSEVRNHAMQVEQSLHKDGAVSAQAISQLRFYVEQMVASLQRLG